MAASAFFLALAFDGYLMWLVAQSWTDIVRFGPAMLAGVAAAFVAVALGEIGILRGAARYGDWMAVATVVAFALMAYALWRGRGRWWRRSDQPSAADDNKRPDFSGR